IRAARRIGARSAVVTLVGALAHDRRVRASARARRARIVGADVVVFARERVLTAADPAGVGRARVAVVTRGGRQDREAAGGALLVGDKRAGHQAKLLGVDAASRIGAVSRRLREPTAGDRVEEVAAGWGLATDLQTRRISPYHGGTGAKAPAAAEKVRPV